MPNFIISEYRTAGRELSGKGLPVGREPALSTQFIAFTTATLSDPFNEQTSMLRMQCAAKAHWKVGPASANPVATAEDPYVIADQPEYIGVRPGHVISVYDGES